MSGFARGYALLLLLGVAICLALDVLRIEEMTDGIKVAFGGLAMLGAGLLLYGIWEDP